MLRESASGSLHVHSGPDQPFYNSRLGESKTLFLPLLPKGWLLIEADHIVVTKDEACLDQKLSEDIVRTNFQYAMSIIAVTPSYASGGAKAR